VVSYCKRRQTRNSNTVCWWKLLNLRRKSDRNWRKFHSAELYVLLKNIILFIKSRRKKCTGIWQIILKIKMRTEYWWGNIKRKYLVGGRIRINFPL